MKQSRKEVRKRVSLGARYRAPGSLEFMEAQCRDLSRGGMFISSANLAPTGTLLRLECRVGADRRAIQGVARVAWVREAEQKNAPRGMGVKFVRLEPGTAEVVDSMLLAQTYLEGVTQEAEDDAPSVSIEYLPEAGHEELSRALAEEESKAAAGSPASTESDGAPSDEEEKPWEAPQPRRPRSAVFSLPYDDDYSAPFPWRKLIKRSTAVVVVLGVGFGAYCMFSGRMFSGPSSKLGSASSARQPPRSAPPQPAPPRAAPAPLEPAPAPPPVSVPASVAPLPAGAEKPRLRARVSSSAAPAGAPSQARKAADSRPSAQPGTSRFDEATACIAGGDGQCAIRLLEGKTSSARELGLLIETYRSIGDNDAAYEKMAEYVKRYSSAPRADYYRRILEQRQATPLRIVR